MFLNHAERYCHIRSYVGIFHIRYIVLFICYCSISCVLLFFVRESFLLFFCKTGTSIPPMIGRARLLILLLFPSLGLIALLTVVVHFILCTWLRFDDYSFLLFGGLKKFVIG